MKTKIPLLLLLFLGLSSCIKDYYAHPDDEKGILTDSNYLYADDLKISFLKNEIEIATVELNLLEPIINTPNATDEVKEQYQRLSNSILVNENLIAELQDIRDLLFKRIPNPPCPEPQTCNDWLRIQYLTERTSFTNLQMIIYDANQTVIAQTEDNIEAINGLDVALNYVVLVFNNTDYKGDIFIKTIRKSKDGFMESFTIRSRIE